MFNIGSEEPAEQYGNDEFFDTDEDTSFTRAQLEGVLQRAGESQQANQQAISQAHPQQVEREQQQQGEGILRTLGRGTMRIGRNIAGGLASGHDLTTSVVGGLAEPVLSGLGDAVMRRFLPQPRPLLDLEAPRSPPRNPRMTIPNISQLPPSIILQPHQPNVGATQQPLPPAVQQPALPATNFQGSSSSSSSGNFQFPRGSATQAEQEKQTQRQPRTRLTKKNLKESSREDTDTPREELNMRPSIIPSKIGIHKLRETFEDANNKNTINTTTYRKYRSLYNQWVSSAGIPAGKKEALRGLQQLYRETVFNR